jgi:Icc-related predicted phosphoesterase
MLIFSDIHGNFETFKVLLDKIPDDKKTNGICIAGDLIDRGPKSKQMIEYCKTNNIPTCLGNHEVMMIEEGLAEASYFIKNGNYAYYDRNRIWAMMMARKL